MSPTNDLYVFKNVLTTGKPQASSSLRNSQLVHFWPVVLLSYVRIDWLTD